MLLYLERSPAQSPIPQRNVAANSINSITTTEVAIVRETARGGSRHVTRYPATIETLANGTFTYLKVQIVMSRILL